MALIVLTSAAGAPGVTSTAVGLALNWNRSVILVDADPGGFQSILAGYLRGQVATGKGLQRVAEAHRDRRPLTEVVSDQTVLLPPVPGETNQTMGRRLLPGFARSANAGLFGPVWADLADTFLEYEIAGIDVIVDAGRMESHGLPQPLLDRADLVAMVSRSGLRSIAAVRNRIGALREQEQSGGTGSNLALILIGEDQPYGRREIGKLLAVPVATVIADDPDAAAVLSDGESGPRRFDRSRLARSLRSAAADLGARIHHRRAQLGLADGRGSELSYGLPGLDRDPILNTRRPVGAEQSRDVHV